ncbi:MAG: PaaI family thioesterase [Desulfobacterium sp.]
MDEKFQQISVIGFMKHNGGLEFRKISNSDYQFKATVQDFHLNPGDITHGGFLMSLMDSGMGTAAHRVLGGQTRAATISLDVKFISASTTGDILLGSAKVLKKTRSLVFMQGEIRCGERLISTAEGIWKVL